MAKVRKSFSSEARNQQPARQPLHERRLLTCASRIRNTSKPGSKASVDNSKTPMILAAAARKAVSQGGHLRSTRPVSRAASSGHGARQCPHSKGETRPRAAPSRLRTQAASGRKPECLARLRPRVVPLGAAPGKPPGVRKTRARTAARQCERHSKHATHRATVLPRAACGSGLAGNRPTAPMGRAPTGPTASTGRLLQRADCFNGPTSSTGRLLQRAALQPARHQRSWMVGDAMATPTIPDPLPRPQVSDNSKENSMSRALRAGIPGGCDVGAGPAAPTPHPCPVRG
jgi:hypothetical protein